MAVYKDKKRGTWFVSYNNTKKRGFETKSDALNYEALLRLKEEDRSIGVKLSVICADFLNYKESRISYPAFQKDKRAVNHFILKHLPDKSISRYTELDMRRYEDEVRATDYSTSHKRYLIHVLKQVFKHSEVYFQNKNNPTYVLGTIEQSEAELKKSINKDLNVWTNDDFMKFIKEVDEPVFAVFFSTLFFTGLRRGEALGLTWKDFNNGQLTIDKQVSFHSKDEPYHVKRLKTSNSYRVIDTGNELNELLNAFKEKEQKADGFNDDWFIFNRNKPLAPSTIERRKKEAVKRSGVRDIRIHDLRHSHASNLLADNINIAAISRRLGHSDINMTLRVYSHLLEESNDELVDNLNKSCHDLATNILK